MIAYALHKCSLRLFDLAQRGVFDNKVYINVCTKDIGHKPTAVRIHVHASHNSRATNNDGIVFVFDKVLEKRG